MRRPLLLLLLVLAGCAKPSQSALHEKYVKAVAEYDRENARAMRMVGDTFAMNQRAIYLAFYMLRGTLPNEQELGEFKEAAYSGRGDVTRYVAHIRSSLRGAVDLRGLSERVELLRTQANKARAEWIAATRRA